MKNYGMPFKNAAIDKLGSKFGNGEPKGQTVKAVTVRPSAEQVSRVKGRMESDINRMDAETHGYERGLSSIKTGWSYDQESMENERKDTQDSFFNYHASPYKGKNMKDTRSVHQASKKANEYAKGEYEKSYNKTPMAPLFPKETTWDRNMKVSTKGPSTLQGVKKKK
jgi:hypothetical protein